MSAYGDTHCTGGLTVNSYRHTRSAFNATRANTTYKDNATVRPHSRACVFCIKF